MRRGWFVMILGLVLVSMTGQMVAAAEQTGAAVPVIQVPQPEFRFSKAIEGQSVSHAFLVCNDGQAPLVIHKLKTD